MAISDDHKAKAKTFRALHRGPQVLVLPNAWDEVSAALMVAAGFPAIATTSSGVANAVGFPDGEHIGQDRMLGIAASIAAHASVPVTADLVAGFGSEPAAVADTVTRAIGIGLAGCNIEDGDQASGKLMDFDLAVARIHAGAEAADKAGLPDFVINARVDPYLRGFGEPSACLDESIRRANAYLAAGAGSAFVPGPVDADTVGKLASAIDGPMNVMAGRPGTLSAAEYEKLGVARISIGGSLALAALGLVRDALATLKAEGTFGYGGNMMSHPEANKLMAAWQKGG
ncbi:MAG: isocitrate lyase/phosphoenolpyruvate mutase family protein [Alphaproteobacteria bacterium]